MKDMLSSLVTVIHLLRFTSDSFFFNFHKSVGALLAQEVEGSNIPFIILAGHLEKLR